MLLKPNYTNLEDEALVDLVIHEDQNLYAHLVKRYEKRLLHYLKKYLPDEDEALDVLQNVFIKTFKNLNGFNHKYRFSSWIYRISHNEALNFIKKNKREISLDLINWEDTLKSNELEFTEKIEKKERQKMVTTILQDLPAKYQDVLLLYFFEQKSYEEISDILMIPMGTVSVRLNRAKAKMKDSFQIKENREEVKNVQAK